MSGDGASVKSDVDMPFKSANGGDGMRVKVLIDSLGNTFRQPWYRLEFGERGFPNLF